MILDFIFQHWALVAPVLFILSVIFIIVTAILIEDNNPLSFGCIALTIVLLWPFMDRYDYLKDCVKTETLHACKLRNK